MSIPGNDGVWVYAVRVTRIGCSQCGVVSTSQSPMNDREEMEVIRSHLNEKHGGQWTP